MRTKFAEPTHLAVTMNDPHAGSVRRWINSASPYNPANVGELAGLLADDAVRMTSKDSWTAPKIVSEAGKPGLFVSFTYDLPGLLKHGTLHLSETRDQWRRKIADIASRAVVYGPG